MARSVDALYAGEPVMPNASAIAVLAIACE
jgi:hypothetical protein